MTRHKFKPIFKRFAFVIVAPIISIIAGCAKSNLNPPKHVVTSALITSFYISPNGSDINGAGSKEAPWKTLDKAFTQNSLITRGDTIFIADGVYAENSSSAGYLNLNRVPRGNKGYVTIQPQNGALGDVTITGAPGTGMYDFETNATAYLYFKWLKFTNANNYKNAIGKLTAGNHIIFNTCIFTVLTQNKTVNYALLSFGRATVTNLSFINCNIVTQGTDDARGINFNTGTQTVDSISVTGCTINTTGHCAIFQGVTRVAFSNNNCTSGIKYGGYCFQLGADHYTNETKSSGTISNNTLNCASGHSLLIGGGVTGATVSGNTIYGGNSFSAGHALVLKNCNLVKIDSNTVYDGYNDGLYFKAATNCIATHNTVINRYGSAITAGCLRLGRNTENNSVCSGNKILYNKFMVQAGQAIYWDNSHGDDGTNICNHNEYNFTLPTLNWGHIYGMPTLGQSLQTLRNAWSKAPLVEQQNDANSTL